MFDGDEEQDPLRVCPPRPRRVPQVHGDQRAVGDDADDGGEVEGEVPAADVAESHGHGFAREMKELVSICEEFGHDTDHGDDGGQRRDGGEERDAGELAPELHVVAVQGIVEGDALEIVTVELRRSLVLTRNVGDPRDGPLLGRLCRRELGPDPLEAAGDDSGLQQPGQEPLLAVVQRLRHHQVRPSCILMWPRSPSQKQMKNMSRKILKNSKETSFIVM